MRLTPLDIRHKEFKRGMRGYVDAEVDEFLDAVADEFERLFKENIELTERLEAQDRTVTGRSQGEQQELATLQAQVARYHEMEGTLQNALITAQQSADDLRAQAARQAEELRAQAERRAHDVLAEAYGDRENVEKDTAALQNQEAEFRLKFRTMLEGYLGQLGAFDETARSRATDYERRTQALRDSIAGTGVPPETEPAEAGQVAGPAPGAPAPESRPYDPGRSRPPVPLGPDRAPAPPPPPLPERPVTVAAPEPRRDDRAEPGAVATPAPGPRPGPAQQRDVAFPSPPDAGPQVRPDRSESEDTALTMAPDAEPRVPGAGTEGEDTALTMTPPPEDSSFFGEEDGGNTEFKW